MVIAVEQKYFGDGAADGPELDRLRDLQDMLDPLAQAALADAGVLEGASVLEIGPGAGSMLNWLSERVGPDGAVTAIDLDPRFVREMDVPNVSIRKGDILAPDDDLGPFDFIYARYVFMHLPDPRGACGTLINLLKSGGKAVLFDPDYRNVRACDPSYPSAGQFNAAIEAALDILRSAGVMDAEYGRRCAGDMEAAGFADVRATGHCELMRGGGAGAARFAQSLPPVEAVLKKYAPGRKIDFAPVYSAYEDPGFLFFTPTEIITTGTRPLATR